MTKLEERFAQYLSLIKAAGEIISWDYEPIKFRLGKGAWYTPDFFVMEASGELVYYEIKGFQEIAARVRIKVAAKAFWMFKFVTVKEQTRGAADWVFEEHDPA